MLNLIVRGLLLLAAVIAGWIVARDAPNFSIVQMAIALLLFVAALFLIAFWPSRWFERIGGRFRRRAG